MSQNLKEIQKDLTSQKVTKISCPKKRDEQGN